ncbi:MAG: MBL fold metallo-hydrolase [Promethearchaeota archaeon]
MVAFFPKYTSSHASAITQPSVNYETAVDSVKFTILIDNYPNGTLNAPWGLSIFIETPELTILFDTGPDPDALRENAEILGISLSEIDFVIISHGHQDHLHGISHIAELNPNIMVYVPENMNTFCKNMLLSLNTTKVEIGPTYSISDGITIIGGLYAPINEQALAINVRGLGLIIFVGCSHPGVVNIVQKAEKDLEIRPYAIFGGFHTLEEDIDAISDLIDELLALNIKKICPSHCSGDLVRNYLQSNYFSHYVEVKVGYSTNLVGDVLPTSISTDSTLISTESSLISTESSLTSIESENSLSFEVPFILFSLSSILILRVRNKGDKRRFLR